MKYGIIADIHANYPALESVLKILEKEGVEGYIILGDIVGYGPQPNECVKGVTELRNASVIAGNHDWACVELEDISCFNEVARLAVTWTKNVLTKENKEYISSLDYVMKSQKFLAVHGSPSDPLDEYLDSIEVFEKNLPFFKEHTLCFVGHNHIPLYFKKMAEDGMIVGNTLGDGEQLQIRLSDITVVNPGSVGQPRDGDVRASCGIFDDDALVFKLLRVPYDLRLVQQDMLQKQLPVALIRRLGDGR